MGQGDELGRAYDDGRRRWPDVRVEEARFRRHCESVLDPARASESLAHGADLYLACACAAHDRRALEHFEREVGVIARAAIARIHRDTEFVAETLQELWQKLLFSPRPSIGAYSGRGSLQAWVRVAATRLALDGARRLKLAAVREAELGEGLFDPWAGSEESRLTRTRYEGVFRSAVQAALGALSAQERNVLRMHVIGRCSIDQIGRAYGVHRATAARWLERARGQVFESVRRELAVQHVELTDRELRSMARGVGGDLDLGPSSERPSHRDEAASPEPNDRV
jgi:RNA polymerase sigma-70 factor (ECF subfamily)